MNARESFLRLGYVCMLEDDKEILYHNYTDGKLSAVIWFYKTTHMYDNSAQTTVALHTAIDLQMDELGWYGHDDHKD